MAKIDVPDYVIDFYSLIYPNLDLNRIEFHWGIPKVFRIGRNPGAITLGSWISNKIWIHFKEGQWDPDTCEGIALIGHELYHAQDVYSMWGGWGWGLIRPWYLAYVYCGILSGFNFREKHYLEEPAYNYQTRMNACFKKNEHNTAIEGPATNPESFTELTERCSDLIVKKKKKSLIKVLVRATKRRFSK